MGAEFESRIVKDRDRGEIEKTWSESIKQSLYDNGHSGYSGTIAEMPDGIDWEDHEFDSRDKAEEHLQDNHNKWDKAMAVSFYRPCDDDKTKNEKWWIIGGWCSS